MRSKIIAKELTSRPRLAGVSYSSVAGGRSTMANRCHSGTAQLNSRLKSEISIAIVLAKNQQSMSSTSRLAGVHSQVAGGRRPAESSRLGAPAVGICKLGLGGAPFGEASRSQIRQSSPDRSRRPRNAESGAGGCPKCETSSDTSR